MKYIYPDHLKAKPLLFLWQLRDIAIIGSAAVAAVLAIVQTGSFMPLAAAAAYAFLTIQFEGVSILDFIKSAANYFIIKQQFFDWRR